MTIILVASTGLLCFCIGYGIGWGRATDQWINVMKLDAETKFRKEYERAIHNAEKIGRAHV